MIGVGNDSYKFLLHASTPKVLLRMYNFFLPSMKISLLKNFKISW